MRKFFIAALLALNVAASSAQPSPPSLMGSMAGDTSLFDDIICKMEDNIAKNYYGDFDTLNLPMQYYVYTYDSAQTLLFVKYMEMQRPPLWLQHDVIAMESHYRKKLGVNYCDSCWQIHRMNTIFMNEYIWNSFIYLNETFAKKDVNSIMDRIRLGGYTMLSDLEWHVRVLYVRQREGGGKNTFRNEFCRLYSRVEEVQPVFVFTVSDTIYESLPSYLLRVKKSGGTRDEESEMVLIINKNDYALLRYSYAHDSYPRRPSPKHAIVRSSGVNTYAKVGNIYRKQQYIGNELGYNDIFDKVVYSHTLVRLWRNALPVDSATRVTNSIGVNIVKQPNPLMLEEWNRFIGNKAE
ncbi:MAG: hypothetical protein LBK18_01635 [Prevotellaceae bacterium]|jgi:hypothetical protein|nr:hypothetical protein [Prevotellaceae bacterium]